jgi:polysaccharide biosynthesis/export protein
MKNILLLVSIILLAGCAKTQNKVGYSKAFNETKSVLVEQYFIGVDDVVEVNVWKNPDLSITVPVRPDGKISVPLIGEVIAGGQTPINVAENITSRLSKFIKDPQVSVILVDLQSHEFLSRVRVAGAVRNALSIQFRQGMTVLDIVLQAGGLDEFASGNSAKLFRNNGDTVETINIYLFDILKDGDMETNFQLQPGDILTIPERVF